MFASNTEVTFNRIANKVTKLMYLLVTRVLVHIAVVYMGIVKSIPTMEQVRILSYKILAI